MNPTESFIQILFIPPATKGPRVAESKTIRPDGTTIEPTGTPEELAAFELLRARSDQPGPVR